MKRVRGSLLALLGGVALAAAEPAPVQPVPVPQPAPPAQAKPPQPGSQPKATEDGGAQPLASLPIDTRAVLRLPDHPRSHARFQESPWLALLATPWGRDLVANAARQPGPLQLLGDLATTDRAELGIAVSGAAPLGHLLAGAAHPDEVVALLKERQARVVAEGQALRATLPLPLYRLDAVLRPGPPLPGLRWSWDELLPLPAAERDQPPTPLADAELVWNARAPWAPAGAVGRADWTITSYGLREHARFAGLPKAPAPGPDAAVVRTVFDGLPKDTIWALAGGRLPEVLAQLPIPPERLDALFRDLGAGGWAQFAPHCGRVLVRLEQGVPLPLLTIDLELDQEAATVVLALLDTRHQFVPEADGTHLGVIGFVPVHAGWVAGHLILTTSSAGVAAAAARPGGFTKRPEVARALAELPPGDLLLAGVSRSGESWSAALSLAPWLARRRPGLGAIAADLRTAGTIGFLALKRVDDTVVLDAGGLCGGPLAAYAISGGFLRLNAAPRPPDPAPPVAPPAPVTPPLAPGQVEF